jgi:hypothetical protein
MTTNDWAWYGRTADRTPIASLGGSYGQIGVYADSNAIPPRFHALAVVDTIPGSNDMYVFGGIVNNMNGFHSFNEYAPSLRWLN